MHLVIWNGNGVKASMWYIRMQRKTLFTSKLKASMWYILMQRKTLFTSNIISLDRETFLLGTDKWGINTSKNPQTDRDLIWLVCSPCVYGAYKLELLRVSIGFCTYLPILTHLLAYGKNFRLQEKQVHSKKQRISLRSRWKNSHGVCSWKNVWG